MVGPIFEDSEIRGSFEFERSVSGHPLGFETLQMWPDLKFLKTCEE